jgi:hypothetical protein
MGLGKQLRRGRPDESDPYRPLSEQEEELVEHDLDEQLKYGEAASAAPPGSPVNVDDVYGLELPLSEGERELVRREVNEQSSPDAPGGAGDSGRG